MSEGGRRRTGFVFLIWSFFPDRALDIYPLADASFFFHSGDHPPLSLHYKLLIKRIVYTSLCSRMEGAFRKRNITRIGVGAESEPSRGEKKKKSFDVLTDRWGPTEDTPVVLHQRQGRRSVCRQSALYNLKKNNIGRVFVWYNWIMALWSSHPPTRQSIKNFDSKSSGQNNRIEQWSRLNNHLLENLFSSFSGTRPT